MASTVRDAGESLEVKVDKSRILCVGLACLDFIQVVRDYPAEDSDQRSLDHKWQRGGNAANNCTVLSQLGASCEFLGPLSSKPTGSFVVEDFKAHGVCLDNCVFYDDCEVPASSVLINSQNGSRTIVHSNLNLPELSFEDFNKLDLSQYSWIHFEGRNIPEVVKMINWVHAWDKGPPLKISVELEKPRVDTRILDIVELADVVFVGKDFAEFMGWKSTAEAIAAVGELSKPGATIVVPWGASGAAARCPDGTLVESPAFPPEEVVDTLGAGDTFLATTVFALSLGKSVADSITLGCQIAGAKVGAFGYQGLDKVYQQIQARSDQG
ncbi:unnamed protein product [Timema podura]|uniref:Carbohydrate kinase PfkB domain-containing protein n=1 Tax=Timema podura TaxID=61482 RepID=A0ABN7NL29_TIMPD|nr:unnamed protein product [Timema podura]